LRPPSTAQPAHRTGRHATLVGIITVVMTLLGWSSVPLFITHFASDLDVWTSNGVRYGFSALLWAPVLIWHWSRKSLPNNLLRAAVFPALFNAIGQVVFAWSFYKTDPTTATFGLRMQIVFVAIGAYLLFPAERELLRRPLTWLAIALVLAGVCGTIFLAPGARAGVSGVDPASHLIGVAMAITGGLLFAGYGLAVRRCMHGYHPVTAFAAISQYTALIMVSLMLIFARDVHTHAWNGGLSAWLLPAGPFALLLLSSVIGIALGHVFYYIAIARLGVAVSSGVIQLQPFLVAIGSYFILAKPVTTGQMITGVIAVAGAVLLLTMQWLVSKQLKRDPAMRGDAPADASEAVAESAGYCLDGESEPAPSREAAKQP
jgi:drug/metabolite transporter (DMT)-like permease